MKSVKKITFILKYKYRAYEPGIKEQIIEMAINGSGTRDTARVLKIDKDTVTSVLKKRKESSTSKSKLPKRDKK